MGNRQVAPRRCVVIERQLVVPVPATRLWEALTEPDLLADWFGAAVTWELRPDAPARFDDHDGTQRRGRVTEVLPGRRLAFRWWEAGDNGDDDADVSEVVYRLDPDGDGTRLVVTERRLDAADSVAGHAGRDARTWTDWDGRLLGAWALATAGVRR